MRGKVFRLPVLKKGRIFRTISLLQIPFFLLHFEMGSLFFVVHCIELHFFFYVYANKGTRYFLSFSQIAELERIFEVQKTFSLYVFLYICSA